MRVINNAKKNSKQCPNMTMLQLGFEVNQKRLQGFGFRLQGSGFMVQGSEFRVQGSGFRVQGSGFGVQGVGVGGWGASLRGMCSRWRIGGGRRCRPGTRRSPAMPPIVLRVTTDTRKGGRARATPLFCTHERAIEREGGTGGLHHS